MPTARLLFCFLLLTVALSVVVNTGCTKEYSCEGCIVRNTVPSRDTTVIRDTTKIDSTLHFQVCSACDSTKPLALNSWSLRNYNSYLCGVVNYAYLDQGKRSFGIGGNPNCTIDTGFRLNASFESLQFDTDRFNVSTTSQSFTLRDNKVILNNGTEYIIRTDNTTPSHTLTVVVDTFLNSTKLMVGRFYGYAYTKENNRTYVAGKFRFTIH